MSDILHDVRAAVRSLTRRPGYTLVAAGILALGLSAALAVFTYANEYFQPFPGADADRLVQIFGVEPEAPWQDISYPDFLDYQEGARGAFDGLAASQVGYAASVRLEAMTDVAFLEAVSGTYFDVLGVKTMLGRGLVAADNRPGAEPVAVLSHQWWRTTFNQDPDVVGRVIYLNYRPYTVVGVATPEFVGSVAAMRPHVWIPFEPFQDRYTSWAARAKERDRPLVRVFGRLKAGASRAKGQAELDTLAAALEAEYPRPDAPRHLRVATATWIDPRTRTAEQPTVWLMAGAALGLLLLVAANVANLLLAVAAGRRREMALRTALGASRGQLVRQVLIENLILASLAGGAALLVAGPASARLGSYFASPSVWNANVARVVTVDLRVFVFGVAMALLTGLVAGLAPALGASRRDVSQTLKSGGAPPDATGRWRGRRLPTTRELLVTAQVALTVVLLVVAGLVLRTLATVDRLDPGFAYQQMLASYVSTSSTSVTVDQREQYFRDLAERLAAEPWVRAVTVSDAAPLSPHGAAELRLDGTTRPERFVVSRVVPGFFETMGIRVVRGRAFTVADRAGTKNVAIVNEALARQMGGGDPVGRQIWAPAADGTEQAYEIVGLVADARVQNFLADPEPVVYFAYPQQGYTPGNALVIATRIDPADAVPRVTRWLRDYEPHLAIVNVLPYTEVARGFTYAQRMNAELFSALALLGLALAAAGIFSVMSLMVTQRTREIGIRMAIGARRADIRRLVVGRSLAPVGLGIAAGVAASTAATGLTRSLLVGVEPTDPLTFAAGTLVLVAAALLASYLPARRATSVDPIVALRQD